MLQNPLQFNSLFNEHIAMCIKTALFNNFFPNTGFLDTYPEASAQFVPSLTVIGQILWILHFDLYFFSTSQQNMQIVLQCSGFYVQLFAKISGFIKT